MRAGSVASGATLFYGPQGPRPDLLLAAQFLIDDLRAEGQRIASLRMTERTFRLRLDGLELAMALSAGPIPIETLAAALHLPPDGSPGLAATDPPGLTDLRTIRTMRALRAHRHAVAVLLRRRGAGPADLDAALHPMLLALIEAAPPGLVLWQATGVLWPGPDFARSQPAALAARGCLLPRPIEGREPCSRGLAPPGSALSPADRRDRAARRSAGRLFDGTPPGPASLLPRLEPATARITRAMRDGDPDTAGHSTAAGPGRGRLIAVVTMLWLMLALWPGGPLQAMLL
jgi:hypothetical protein